MDIRLTDIVMQFPGTRALDNVSVTFHNNEVHGLIGENGAGKSTLVSILGGSLRPTSGQIAIGPKTVRLTSPHDALIQGIAHVSQEGSLVPGLSGAENILLGHEPKLAGLVIRKGALRRQASELLTEWFPKVSIDLGRPVAELPMADRKVIEIVRALRGSPRIVILDEPTATLPAREKEQLGQIIRSLPQRGVGVVLISHFLSEIKALSDRITVLRDGQHICSLPAGELSEDQLIELMLRRAGGTQLRSAASKVKADAKMVLDVRDWHVGAVHVPHFNLRAGEIVGLIGLTGAGHFGFARSLHNPAGARCLALVVDGKPVEPGPPRRMQSAGIALVPDHRMEYALIGDWSLRENLSMVHPGHGTIGGGILSLRREEAEASRIMKLMNVKAHSSRQLLRELSGGNKQKISIGKWLYGASDRYRVMIFIEPTEGVDIGAKAEIYAEMRRLAAQGAGIIIASSDLLEIEAVTHRVIPFVRQRLGPEILAADFSENTFITAISGAAA
ncbi:MAG: sugar ABC transporter ATP-binding protein [Paracoccus sp. (in: a-proteobacteria)]|nr:sugar ABC transporter ATP-binding protein [Paracoccus sp. (in: a-proteobacteria)]